MDEKKPTWKVGHPGEMGSFGVCLFFSGVAFSLGLVGTGVVIVFVSIYVVVCFIIYGFAWE